MHKNDIARFFYLINTNLDKSINMGFHSHNNLQLSFSNSQEFFEYVGDRVISLDASIYGMGRGAGNLNTELIANYVNGGILFLIIWRLLMVVILIMPLIWLRNRRLL